MQLTPPISSLRFSLRTQITLALGVVGLILVVVAVSALAAMANLQRVGRQALDVDAPLSQAATQVALATLLCRTHEKTFFLYINEAAPRERARSEWQTSVRALNAAIETFVAAAPTVEDRRQANVWSLQLEAYQIGFLRVTQKVEIKEITTPDAAGDALTPDQQRNIDSLTESALATARAKAAAAQRAGAALDTAASTATWLVGGITLLALLTAAAWSLLFPARLVRPIIALQRAVKQVADGALQTRVAPGGNDEIGALAQSFNAMATTIQQRTADRELQFTQAEAARAEAEAARGKVAEQLATISAQQSVIREMSVPMLPVAAHTLVLPLIGALDSARMHEAQQQALQTIARERATTLILDVTGVSVIDTAVAGGLLQMIQAAELLGCNVVLVGIRPEVAQTIVSLGIDLATVATRSSLRSALEHARAED